LATRRPCDSAGHHLFLHELIAPVNPIPDNNKGDMMSITTILLIILILMLVGALPMWGYSSGWGYGPSGGLGLIVLILLILLLTGRV
jgi:hypothetical protein